jgi:hypothetical protein
MDHFKQITWRHVNNLLHFEFLQTNKMNGSIHFWGSKKMKEGCKFFLRLLFANDIYTKQM